MGSTERCTRVIETCPKCGAMPFRPFLRGMISHNLSFLGWLFKRFSGTALICWTCKDIVGWEYDDGLTM